MLSERDIFSYWKVLAVICRDCTYLTNHGFSAGGVVNPLDALSRSPNHPGRFRQSPGQGSYYAGPAYQSAFVDGVQIGDRPIEAKRLKWTVFRDFPAGQMYSVMKKRVFPFIKKLWGKRRLFQVYGRHHFKLPMPLLFSKVVDALNEILRLMNESQVVDVRGDTYALQN